MTKRKWLLLVLLLAAAAAVTGIMLYDAAFVTVNGTRYRKDTESLDLQYQSVSAEEYDALGAALPDCDILWTPEFQGTEYPMDTREFTVTTLSTQDLDALDRFPQLSVIHAEDCTDYENLLALISKRPECRVIYNVAIHGREYPHDSTYARIPDPDMEQLNVLLPYLPQLKTLLLTGKLPALSEIQALQADFPDITVNWQVDGFFDRILNSADAALDLTDTPLTGTEEVEEVLPYLPELKQVNLCGTGLTEAEVKPLIEAWPEITFLFDLTIGNVTVRTDAEEIDISWNKITPEQIEALLPYFPNLKKVVMCGCGIDNETMDALNRRHEDIKFVWQVSVGSKWVRTDITSFIPFKLYVDYFVEGELDNLKYCTDMVALDLGHQRINTCEFVAYMPNLKYLIIADTQIMDISPLEGLENLEFLEMFLIYSQDYTPLLSLKNLKDLNLAWTYGDYKIIAQMPWLERCWWGGKWHNMEVREYLTSHCPNTQFEFDDGESTGSGWREGELYYEMRDALGMFYMH